MLKSRRTNYAFLISNMLLAYFASVLSNKTAELIRLSFATTLMLTLATLFFCIVSLVEYENYRETADIRQSFVLRSAKWFIQAANNRVTTIPGRWLEVRAIMCIALSMLISLSIFSYDAGDIVDGAPQRVNNWIGVVGAQVAKSLIERFGLWAYSVPVLVFFLGWLVFRAGNPGRSTKLGDD